MVKAVEPSGIEPVFNLKVMKAESFFVGDHGLLVHDDGEVRPVLDPFDGAVELTGSHPPARAWKRVGLIAPRRALGVTSPRSAAFSPPGPGPRRVGGYSDRHRARPGRRAGGWR